jgi:hypothetical protein
VRHHDVNAARVLPHFEPGFLSVEMRLFYVEDAPLDSTAREQVLRPLKNEIPTQVRETQEVEHVRPVSTPHASRRQQRRSSLSR